MFKKGNQQTSPKKVHRCKKNRNVKKRDIPKMADQAYAALAAGVMLNPVFLGKSLCTRKMSLALSAAPVKKLNLMDTFLTVL